MTNNIKLAEDSLQLATVNTIPSYPPQYWPQYTYSPIKSNWVTVNKAENGFIVEKDGKIFIASTPEEVTKLLTEEK